MRSRSKEDKQSQKNIALIAGQHTHWKRQQWNIVSKFMKTDSRPCCTRWCLLFCTNVRICCTAHGHIRWACAKWDRTPNINMVMPCVIQAHLCARAHVLVCGCGNSKQIMRTKSVRIPCSRRVEKVQIKQHRQQQRPSTEEIETESKKTVRGNILDERENCFGL